MPETEYVIDAFVNAIKQTVLDIEQTDIDNNPIAVRASKSYWVAEGWIDERWKDHGLPQIAVHKLRDRQEGGNDTEDSRWEEVLFIVDVFASGRGERRSMTGQIKKGLYSKNNRVSMNKSGFKMDRMISDNVNIDDEMLPQKVFRETMTFRVYFKTSGA